MDHNYQGIFDAVCDGLIITDLETGLVVEANTAALFQHGCTPEEFIGHLLVDFIHPTGHKTFAEYIQSFQEDGVYDARLLHTRQSGNTFYAEWRGKKLFYLDRSCFLAIVREINKDALSDQSLSRRVDTRKHEQETLLAISHTLASTLELQPEVILDQLRELIEYTHGSFFVVQDAKLTTLAMRGTRQLNQSPQLQIHLQGLEGLDIILNGRKPILVSDLSSDDPKAIFFRLLLDDGAAVLREGVRSWMWVPLAVKDRLIGGLGLAHTRANYFTKPSCFPGT